MFHEPNGYFMSPTPDSATVDKLSNELEGGHVTSCSQVCCAICKILEQRFTSWEPLALTRKSLIYIRYCRTRLVLCVQVEGIKAMLQNENCCQPSWGIKARKILSLEMDLHLFQVKHLYFWHFWTQKKLFPMWSVPDMLPGMSWAKQSDLRRSWSAASHRGWEKGSRLVDLGMWKVLCGAFSGLLESTAPLWSNELFCTAVRLAG